MLFAETPRVREDFREKFVLHLTATIDLHGLPLVFIHFKAKLTLM
jgi:hypothetical protein